MFDNAQRVRQCLALGSGGRGAGLGNELLAWGKSYVAASELGAEMLYPAWLLNQYSLPEAFGWSRRHMLQSEWASRIGRRLLVTREMYEATGEADYGRAVAKICEDLPEGAGITLLHQGMWGGYRGIARARRFLLHQLMSAPTVLDGVDEFHAAQAPPTIGVHVRRGDFASKPPLPGEFNRTLPSSWYLEAMRAVTRALDGEVRFLVCSDGDVDDLEAGVGAGEVCVVGSTGPHAALRDLAILAQCDAVICSVSSFSMAAAFLGDTQYLWYRPQLRQQVQGLTLWESTWAAGAVPAARPRGLPWEVGDELPSWWATNMTDRARLRDRRCDLLFHGAVPIEGASTR